MLISNSDASVHGKKRKKYFHTLFLETLDIILSACVIAPCVIAYWRGTWELLGVLIYPKSRPMSALVSLTIGTFGHSFFTMTQFCLKKHLHPDKCRLTFYVSSRLYTAIFGIVRVNMWRGSWVMCDYLTSGNSYLLFVIVMFGALLLLIGTRTVRNLCAAPFALAVDHQVDYFDVRTMFKVPGFFQPGLYILDTFFSGFVIGSLVVIAWRGLWGLLDLTLYPNNKIFSAYGSLVIGYGTVTLIFSVQPVVQRICERVESGLRKLILCDIFYFISFIGAVNTWRGIWMLLDIYFYPDNKLLSFWLTNIIPFLLLAALKCSNSILDRSVFIDGEEPGGECVQFPIKYVRLHIQRERTKNHERHLVTEAQSILIDKKPSQQPKIIQNMDSSQTV